MKRTASLFLLVMLLTVWNAGCAAVNTPEPSPTPRPATQTALPASPTPDPAAFLGRLHWFGTSAILYHGSQNIYFDPVSLAGNLPPADIILVSHGHSDHWSISDLKKVLGPTTTLIVSSNVAATADSVRTQLGIPATILHEGDSLDIHGVKIQAVAAYDSSGHLRSSGGLGYLVTIDGQRLYFAGGTNFYPEMASLESDVAVYPAYSRADVEQMAASLPAKSVILVHNSIYLNQALAKLAAQQGSHIQFVDLTPGPYNP